MGGTTIATDDEARAFAKAVMAHPKVWAEYGMDVAPRFRVGDEVMLEPCVNINFHPCPKVDLWPENAPAADLVYASLSDVSRPLLPAYVEAVAADMHPDVARTMVTRAFRALNSRVVAEYRAAQLLAEKGD